MNVYFRENPIRFSTVYERALALSELWYRNSRENPETYSRPNTTPFTPIVKESGVVRCYDRPDTPPFLKLFTEIIGEFELKHGEISKSLKLNSWDDVTPDMSLEDINHLNKENDDLNKKGVGVKGGILLNCTDEEFKKHMEEGGIYDLGLNMIATEDEFYTQVHDLIKERVDGYVVALGLNMLRRMGGSILTVATNIADQIAYIDNGRISYDKELLAKFLHMSPIWIEFDADISKASFLRSEFGLPSK